MATQNSHVNGGTADGVLDIIVVGAGIGGLCAAIGLRQQGHRVKVLEQSRFANEVGAAIHLAPNCNGLLRRYGLNPEDIGANATEAIVDVDPSTSQIRYRIDVGGVRAAAWAYPWQLVHRAHLHTALKEMATGAKGKGRPVELHTSSRVVYCDPQAGIIKVESGEEFSGDVIVGADGVHSTLRKHVVGDSTKPFVSGKSAFRFLIPRSVLEQDPVTAPLTEKGGELWMWIGEDRRLVMYPCVNNTMMNFVAIHPSTESDAPSGEEWNQGASKERLLKVFSSFGEQEKALLSHCDPDTLKVWKLYDMKTLPKWTTGKLALIGDAAHPFLPHQGQGGAMAIESGVSLAVVLPLGTPKAQIPERLKLFERCRRERATKIQHFTRLAGRDISEAAKSGETIDMQKFTGYNFGHDEWDHSSQMLREWQWSRKLDVYWRMPVGYGPANGPRQDVLGNARSGAHSRFTTYSIKFNTSRTLLQNLLPTKQFSFASPATVCQATFACTTLDKMDWLGGGGYSHCGLYIHGVQYKKRDGSVLNGTHLSVLFESLSDPITTGREELGMPKLFCEIEPRLAGNKAHVKMNWRGAVFGELEWNDLSEPIEPALAVNGGKFAMGNGPNGNIGANGGPPPGANPFAVPPDEGQLVYRYIPAVGQRGKADVEYACFVPNTGKSETRVVERSQSTSNATFKFQSSAAPGFETIRHVADRLAEIPIYSIVEAKVDQGYGVEDVGQTVRIE